jgi:hypothetical protein
MSEDTPSQPARNSVLNSSGVPNVRPWAWSVQEMPGA